PEAGPAGRPRREGRRPLCGPFEGPWRRRARFRQPGGAGAAGSVEASPSVLSAAATRVECTRVQYAPSLAITHRWVFGQGTTDAKYAPPRAGRPWKTVRLD